MTKDFSHRPPVRSTLLCALGVLVSITLAFATPAPAEATRPMVRPPLVMKLSPLEMPTSLDHVVKKRLSGLELEDKKVRAKALANAKDYAEIRRGKWDEARVAKWITECEKSLGKAGMSPFCKTELERTRDEEPSRLPSEIRAERQEAATNLRAFEFSKLKDKSMTEVMQALGQVGDVHAIRPIAEKLADTRACAPSAVTSAVGYKLEELFPDSAAVELTRKVYKKSGECGSDFGAAQASFRLGLISIWQNKCADVDALMKKVESVPEASQYHARAKYWRHHCASVAKDDKARDDVRELMVKQHPMTFHNLAINGNDAAVMARVMVETESQTVAYRSVVRPDLNEIIRGAEALEKIGEPVLAGDYIDRNVADLNTMEPETRLYLAAFLDRMTITLTKFKVMSSLFADAPRLVSRGTMQMMFPMQFAHIVKAQSKDIDPLLVLALMRQESAFNSQAVSLVGARGLMQVMPATARSIASVRANKLFDPKTNVTVGTKYLTKQLTAFKGDVELTLAAYNAGPARVDRWVKRYPTDNKFLFLDFIPFKETREYVSSILRNYYWYVTLYGRNAENVAASESKKVQVAPEAKVQAIMSANAGLVAWQGPTGD